eukprot:Rhum_TRINITY_DN13969_c2_g2::Rhum_TRINITY_DN13969_c2_g2_i1::g.66830::m.66830
MCLRLHHRCRLQDGLPCRRRGPASPAVPPELCCFSGPRRRRTVRNQPQHTLSLETSSDAAEKPRCNGCGHRPHGSLRFLLHEAARERHRAAGSRRKVPPRAGGCRPDEGVGHVARKHGQNRPAGKVALPEETPRHVAKQRILGPAAGLPHGGVHPRQHSRVKRTPQVRRRRRGHLQRARQGHSAREGDLLHLCHVAAATTRCLQQREQRRKSGRAPRRHNHRHRPLRRKRKRGVSASAAAPPQQKTRRVLPRDACNALHQAAAATFAFAFAFAATSSLQHRSPPRLPHRVRSTPLQMRHGCHPRQTSARELLNPGKEPPVLQRRLQCFRLRLRLHLREAAHPPAHRRSVKQSVGGRVQRGGIPGCPPRSLVPERLRNPAGKGRGVHLEEQRRASGATAPSTPVAALPCSGQKRLQVTHRVVSAAAAAAGRQPRNCFDGRPFSCTTPRGNVRKSPDSDGHDTLLPLALLCSLLRKDGRCPRCILLLD